MVSGKKPSIKVESFLKNIEIFLSIIHFSVKVSMKYKLFFWIPIPCLDIIPGLPKMGTCTYDDICELIPKLNICPLKKGTYTVEETVKLPSLDDMPIPFDSGTIKIEAKAENEGKQIGCAEVKIDFELTD